MQVVISVVPHPKLKRDYVGRTIRTKVKMENGYIVIPEGKIGTVDYQSPKGSSLVFEACDCCGIKARISGVSADHIEFIQIG